MEDEQQCTLSVTNTGHSVLSATSTAIMCKTTDIFTNDLPRDPDLATTVVSHIKPFKAVSRINSRSYENAYLSFISQQWLERKKTVGT